MNAHLPIRDIHMLIATSPQPPGLARREQIGPCRPWIRFWAASAPHSPQLITAGFQPCVATTVDTFAGHTDGHED
ncbi:GbcA Glycine betaine demethylase subunit A [Pseudomonas chlororaphis subsp. piscium]|nr:GbcA Glycine betaine demethylase subunit A [Pseudomonas chlororaphis subsp. piscium]AZC60028.1 GbcA Glycine betaine demethylase subunit A [Pseudomonas chlororaphis subsp. piscium]AZC66172.1 GbcA Glycine betaine demethylase subunit A [Pseudomonas chlororaphis subsp. piscium]AZC72435.1 GbcA Glycine betaine demethylase subunit A [Pseudomonas chlororaphis subsp. piscium]AZC78650.1 GbcA Glycine betaine demethylase subunit A [Pseudomonas chlororaphis subsp. piscium]